MKRFFKVTLAVVWLVCLALILVVAYLSYEPSLPTRRSAAGNELYNVYGPGGSSDTILCDTPYRLERVENALMRNDQVAFVLLMGLGCQAIGPGREVELLRFVEGEPQVRYWGPGGVAVDGFVRFRRMKPSH